MRHSAIKVSAILGLLTVYGGVLSASAALLACSGDDAHSGPPRGPSANDPAFVVSGVPRYLLAGDALTPSTATMTLTVTAPAGTGAIELWLDGQGPTSLTASGDSHTVTVDAAALVVGSHGLVLAVEGEAEGFYRFDFVKGHALYIVTSTDWDTADNTDYQMTLQEDLHTNHPALKLTHLVGPYTFTDPTVSDAREQWLVDWTKRMRDTYGDEIGTHVHPYCNFVEAAGLTCKTAPSTVHVNDATGYTVRMGAYDRDEWNIMFAKVDELWAAAGFGKPTSFRAGGWTLEISTLQALADSGYVVDSSAVNWARMEEWQGVMASGSTVPAQLYEWNMAQWSAITETTQAYYATEDSLLPGGAGATIPVLEATDNGIMADYVTGQEMIGIFSSNWNGQPLAVPTLVSYGYHPPSIDDYWMRLEQALTYIDDYLAQDGNGPVIYINMSEAVTVWPAP